MRFSTRQFLPGLSVALMASAIAVSTTVGARADADDAKRIFKEMSDYLASQDHLAFDFDTVLEVVSSEGQKLAFASSGAMEISRPDKIRATRTGGFSDVELLFDGTTLTLFGKSVNAYGQVEIPGSIDHLIDELRDTYQRPIPGADLLLSNVYDELMPSVTDVKDLGSGVIGGVECNHFAFRTEDVDWQIWIAVGDAPYPCRYVITSKQIDTAPQYTVQVSDWKTGGAAADFVFKNDTDAEKLALDKLPDLGELPAQYSPEGAK